MDELILEPYAVVQCWHLPDAEGQWENLLGEYLQKIAQQCTEAGKCVVGHIKTLSIFSDQKFLRVSVVGENIPPSVEGRVPPGSTKLELTLNVLVYGLKRNVIEQITKDTANQIATQKKGVVHQKEITSAGEHLHH